MDERGRTQKMIGSQCSTLLVMTIDFNHVQDANA